MILKYFRFVILFIFSSCSFDLIPEGGGGTAPNGEGCNKMTMEGFAYQLCMKASNCSYGFDMKKCEENVIDNVLSGCEDWSYFEAENCLKCMDEEVTCNKISEDFKEVYYQCYHCDFKCPRDTLDAKPNIYLYPEKMEKLRVEILFITRGEIVVSDPEYGSGWDVTVDPSGKIDGIYDYLFYEAMVPFKFQTKNGWIKTKDELQHFFEKDLKEVGFQGREINDFTDFWIPKLNESDCNQFQLYPQNEEIIERMTLLKISKEPDSLLRYRYVIECNPDVKNLPVPRKVKPFQRDGFIVTEWGVVLRL